VGDLSLHFVSDDNLIVYGLAPDGELYYSDDQGASWEHHSIPEIMPKINEVKGKVGSIFVSGSGTSKIVYIFSKGARHLTLWVSTNNGRNYTLEEDVAITTTPQSISVHPQKLNVAVLLVDAAVFNQYDVWYTTNSGTNWTRLAEIPQQGKISWSVQGSTTRLYFNQLDGSEEKNPWNSELVWIDDNFAEVHKLPKAPANIFRWFLGPTSTIGAVVCIDLDLCNDRQMHISLDGGESWSIASFPATRVDTPDQTNYYVWDISEQTVWTYVERFCADKANNATQDNLCWGDLFHSTLASQKYVLSLRFVRHHQFNNYEGIPGIYLANQYVTSDGTPAPEDPIRSLITYNKGSTWDLIAAPVVDASGQKTNCLIEDGCSLHLHSRDSEDKYSDYLYSVQKAVGLMIGSGNIGKTLLDRDDQVSMFFSRNGGVAWTEVRKGRWIYEVGDYGSVIVAIQLGSETDQFIFTIDDGDTWETVDMEVDDFLPTNIRVGDGWDSTTFILHGLRKNVTDNTTSIVVVQIDMAKSFIRKCSEKTGDFENWSPKDEHGNCVMGHSTQFRRRKHGVACSLGDSYNSTTTSTTCPCTDYDYDCEHCYEREELNKPCVWSCGDIPPPPAPEYCKASDKSNPIYYELPPGLGYKKVDQNNCVPVEKKPVAKVNCNDYLQSVKAHQPWWELFTKLMSSFLR